MAVNNRQKMMRRQAFIFHAGLRRIRERREFIRGTGLDFSLLFKNDLKTTAAAQTEPEADFEPMTEEEIESEGLSERTECPLQRLGIFQQEDIAAMAESAVIEADGSDEAEAEEGEEVEGEPGEEYTLPSSPALSHDTFAVLRRLGMLDSDSESESGSDCSDESDSEESVPESESESDAETEPQDGDETITPWNTTPATFPTSSGCLNLASVVAPDADEDSSVSSLFVGEDQDSFDSDCESPDTEEEVC